MTHDIRADIDGVADIPAIPTILDVVCRTTGMRFATVARVTRERWIACAVDDRMAFGLGVGDELSIETTLCDEVRRTHKAVVIDHVAEDPVYRDHPTPARYGFQSYIAVPIITPGGRFFGTLCAIDPAPARLKSTEVTGMFRLFADLIAFHLDARERLAASEATLSDARVTALLRDQFIAVLGHDLRSPLAALDAGASLLARAPLDEKARGIVALMRNTVARMTGLVENMLDFARGRFGDGIVLHRDGGALRPTLEQVVAEARIARPGRAIDTAFALAEDTVFPCDRGRIGQLCSNLIANALIHGADHRPIRVTAGIEGGTLAIAVANANAGEPIPPAARERLFQPFTSGDEAGGGRRGLGLGLYIANEIARAHGGTLTVDSGPEETRFTLRIPAS